MKSVHKLLFTNSKNLGDIESESTQLIVTSPPYPMIEMWDELFAEQNSLIKEKLIQGDSQVAFELMHCELDAVWTECYRILQDGGFICINIGDATRNINKEFQLFSNHARILKKLIESGFQILPEILWRKQTNAPNKFMGSGMLPAGAYVTLEHEYVLIARKGSKRQFKTDKDKALRQQSAYFWEERNIWFSDIWDFKGVNQRLRNDNLREKSAAFPFELAYRLINMYSTKQDTVVDPFVGTGTTILAGMISERNTIGIEISDTFKELITERLLTGKDDLNSLIVQRIEQHNDFIQKRKQNEKEIKYTNLNHNFPVVTKQEEKIILNKIKSIENVAENEFHVFYE